MITKQQISVKLVEAIRASGKTQIQIAKEIGVSRQSVSQYAKGQRVPTLGILVKLCKALNLDATDIFCLN
ncbi:MAG: helix-turn-helix transcriptional regulator [Clostridiales bacterium]|nr:helix-turn-helix transcriptional regulator [Clostridiales bacterium]